MSVCCRPADRFTQKSGIHPHPVHSFSVGVWFVLFWQFSCLSNTCNGKLVCVASQYGGSFVYLQAQIWKSLCPLLTVHFNGLIPVPLCDPEKKI